MDDGRTSQIGRQPRKFAESLRRNGSGHPFGEFIVGKAAIGGGLAQDSQHPIAVSVGCPQVTGRPPGTHEQDSTGSGMLTISS
jgi:hypothetical protein